VGKREMGEDYSYCKTGRRWVLVVYIGYISGCYLNSVCSLHQWISGQGESAEFTVHITVLGHFNNVKGEGIRN
jgi:hypothetical protein